MDTFENTHISVLLVLIFLLGNPFFLSYFCPKSLRPQTRTSRSLHPQAANLYAFMCLCFFLSLKSQKPTKFFFHWITVFCSRTEAIDGYVAVSCVWKGGMEERGQEKTLTNTENPRVFLSCLIHFWCKQLARLLGRSENVTEVRGTSSGCFASVRNAGKKGIPFSSKPIQQN